MSSDARLGTVSGAVLLGGASSRMGRDKAALELGGRPAAARVAGLLAELCEDVLLVGGQPPAGTPGRAVPDLPGPRSSLRGLVTALDAARCESVWVVACDLPLVSADLLLALVAWPAADAVVPRQAGRPQPLCALYRREAVLPVARERLAAEQLALRGLLDAVDTSYLDDADLAPLDPEGVALTNVNTPEDLDAARRRTG